ncbi:MAG TPA: polysaccharide deacetylase family protein [Thermodesulfobacteriaceae bacterium]|nr:polysaccharide deacetylase family protein [Thermodesulfobacteriaceae bacterium]
MPCDIVTNVETDEAVAALTFDDGPHPIYTPQLLDILDRHKAKATFFMVGKAAGNHRNIVKMASRAGHAIGNHSWGHHNLKRIASRLRRLKWLLASAWTTAPYGCRLFRPPYGAYNNSICYDASLLQYRIILWNASAQDWIPQDSNQIARKIEDRMAPGTIFLLHDAIYSSHLPDSETMIDRTPMLKGLDAALEKLKSKIDFITVPDLLRTGRPVGNWPLNSA